MRNLLFLVLITACELQPAPPKPPPAAPAPTEGSATGSAAGSDVDPTRISAPRPAPPPIPVTAECEQAGIKLADLMIAGADPSQKPAFEVDRANIVRRTEVACTQQRWIPAALACIAQSNTDGQARACLEKFPAPGLVPQGGGSGSAARSGAGSAAGSGAGSASTRTTDRLKPKSEAPAPRPTAGSAAR